MSSNHTAHHRKEKKCNKSFFSWSNISFLQCVFASSCKALWVALKSEIRSVQIWSFWVSSHLRALVTILGATKEFKEGVETQVNFCTWNLQKQITVFRPKNPFPPTPEGAGGKGGTCGAVGSRLQVLLHVLHWDTSRDPAIPFCCDPSDFSLWTMEEHSDLSFFIYLCQNPTLLKALRLRCCSSTNPADLQDGVLRVGNKTSGLCQVFVLGFRQTLPALPACPGKQEPFLTRQDFLTTWDDMDAANCRFPQASWYKLKELSAIPLSWLQLIQ